MLTYVMIILAIASTGAAIYIYIKARKTQESLQSELGKKNLLVDTLERKTAELSQQSQGQLQKIDTLENTAMCMEAVQQQKEAELSSLAEELSQMRQKTDSQKIKLADITKHLQVLQRTIMTDTGIIKTMFSDFFVLYKPWDVVGGDFYKFIKRGDFTIVACGNCGHTGSAGLIKGLMNIVFLQEIVDKGNPAEMESGKILDSLRSKYAHLADKNIQYRTDEDIPVNFSVCIINEKQRTLNYAGAYGSLCLLRKSYPGTSRKENDLHEFRGDRMNFAVSFGRRKNYTTEFVELEKNDRIYLKTDGFANQRGGSNNDRFGDAYLRQLMMKHANEPMLEQKHAFEEEFNNWKGNNAKGNDILVIGLALKVAGK